MIVVVVVVVIVIVVIIIDARRTLGTTNQAIYCNLQDICFSLIDLDTLIIMSPKIDAPYLWIQPLGLVPLNLAYRLLWIIIDRLYIPVITLHLSIVAKKHSIATITQLWSLELLIKTPLLHMLYYMNWLTHDFWTRTGRWEFDHCHGAGTSSPSHWQQVEEQAPKPVGWTMCFLLMTLVPIQKLCVNIYICICIPYMSSVIGYIYIYIYNGNVIQYWQSCTPSRSVGLYFWGVCGSWAECHFLFSLV